MADPNSFYSTWQKLQPPVDSELPVCTIALEFQKKLDELVFFPLGSNHSEGQIAQAKFLLQEEWHTFRKSIPSQHRVGVGNEHSCVDAVYLDAFDRLHLFQLIMRPPIIIVQDYEALAHPPQPPQPPAPPPVQVSGIFIGEQED